jgi:predicted ATPase
VAFVGRQAELQQLTAAFEAASNAQGKLMLLVGEPGIGKTALIEQLREFVLASGGRSLVGHCYEEGSFRPPYQPFVESSECIYRSATSRQHPPRLVRVWRS